MSTFDFSTATATVTPEDEQPKITKPRNLTVNPLKDQFALSLANMDENGYGQWITLTLPGKPHETDGKITHYGDTVSKATSLLKRAGRESDPKVSVRFSHKVVNSKTIALMFRAVPLITQNRKAKTDEATDAK